MILQVGVPSKWGLPFSQPALLFCGEAAIGQTEEVLTRARVAKDTLEEMGEENVSLLEDEGFRGGKQFLWWPFKEKKKLGE